jgi:hypothetical protein
MKTLDLKYFLFKYTIVFSAIIYFAFVVYGLYKKLYTDNVIMQQAILAEHHEKDSQSLLVEDGWGTHLNLEVHSDEESRIYTVISAGKDGIFDTDDDLTASEVDVNWSRKIGRGTVKMLKEATKGAIQGIWSTTKFKKDVPDVK